MARWVVVCAGLALIAGLGGCSSSPAPGSAEEQRRAAVHRAADYCKNKGMTMRIDGLGGPARSGQAASELQFSCVKAK